ncbi:MAG: ATP-binding cassette domain-containing protein, partial [Acidimicrobiia bacterium]
MSDQVVIAKGVGKTFGSGSEQVQALSGIDLEIDPGDFVSLIGPSGCGKSTLLRLIGDLVSPTEGALTVNGKTPNQARLDRDYGIVFQSATLLDWRTVQK